LAFGSHKGGTGRTSSVLALAWTWGQVGRKVALVDADPLGSAELIACGPEGLCSWPNVEFFRDLHSALEAPSNPEVIVVDCPALTETQGQELLTRVQGVVLTSLADPLSLRTSSVAFRVIRNVRETNQGLRLLGLLMGICDEKDPMQTDYLRHLRRTPGVLLEPPIPFQIEISDWALSPGSDLPEGPVRLAWQRLAVTLEQAIGLERQPLVASHPEEGAVRA
jgi:cellulose biosynthesis protein BcsQ